MCLCDPVQPQQGCLFEAELIFGADGQLTLFPPMHLFREVVCGAVLSVADSALQVRGGLQQRKTLGMKFHITKTNNCKQKSRVESLK